MGIQCAMLRSVVSLKSEIALPKVFTMERLEVSEDLGCQGHLLFYCMK